MDPLTVYLQLDNLHCTAEGDGPGNAEPYLWLVYFKLDADSLATLRATVITRVGDHGDLLDSDVGGGDDVHIPPGLGALTATLKPIELGGSRFGGVVGCVAIVMEQDNTPDDAIVRGHQALNAAVQEALDGLIPPFFTDMRLPTPETIAALVDEIRRKVHDAVAANVAWTQWLWGLGNMDDTIGTVVHVIAVDDLPAPGLPARALRSWWIEQSVTFNDLHGQPLASLRPGDHAYASSSGFGVRVPRGWRVWLFPQPGQQGAPRLVVHDQLVLAEVRSVRIDLGAVVLFTAPGFEGRNVSFDAPGDQDADVLLAALARAPVASVRVPDGWRVTAWSGANFTGRSAILTEDAATLPAALGGQLASLRIERAEATSEDGDWELLGRAMILPPPVHELDVRYAAPPVPAIAAPVTVVAIDTTIGQPVAGRVLINGVDVAATNEPFTFTFRARRVRRVVWLSGEDTVPQTPHQVTIITLVWLDTVVVVVPGFPSVTLPPGGVDTGLVG